MSEKRPCTWEVGLRYLLHGVVADVDGIVDLLNDALLLLLDVVGLASALLLGRPSSFLFASHLYFDQAVTITGRDERKTFLMLLTDLK